MTISKFSKYKSGLARLSFLRRNSGGFTLIETLVAISILLIAVVGPISLIGDALHKLYFAKDEMVAINLAQEGIEVVRQWRDSDMLANNTTTDIFSLASPAYYIVDANPAAHSVSTNVQQPVYLNNGFYEQRTLAPATQFKRLVTISTVSSTERQVTSTVTWNTGNTPGTITVTEYLFKWAI